MGFFVKIFIVIVCIVISIQKSYGNYETVFRLLNDNQLPEAIEVLSKISKSGDHKAAFFVGACHIKTNDLDEGQCTCNMAFDWFEYAAEQGNLDAQRIINIDKPPAMPG